MMQIILLLYYHYLLVSASNKSEYSLRMAITMTKRKGRNP